MAKGGVAKVVGEGYSLAQILIQVQRAGDGPGDLRNFDGVREPGAEHIAFVINEDLCLVFKPAEGR
jgi:hypothetical protein